jgi:hypothetical protein
MLMYLVIETVEPLKVEEIEEAMISSWHESLVDSL